MSSEADDIYEKWASRVNFLTPTELLTRAPLGSIPRTDVPGKGFNGKINMPWHTGTSTGKLTANGYVVDNYAFEIKCVEPGPIGIAVFEVNVNLIVPSPPPIPPDHMPMVIDFSVNETVISRGNQNNNKLWNYEVGITGVVLSASSGALKPGEEMFDVSDTWTFDTSASQMMFMVCKSLSDYYRKWCQNTAQCIWDIDDADRQMLCEWGRWKLCAGRGNVPADWVKMAEVAREHFKLESEGDILTNVVPNQDTFVFPDIEKYRRPYKSDHLWRFH